MTSSSPPWVRVASVLVIIAALAVALFFIFHHTATTHHATCWNPTYASSPTASWARHPSATHRHGRGPRGSNVCG